MYQALYRKYRPRCFGDVTGQDHITQTLREQMKSGRLSHAYLFVGTRGTGKTTCAKILSRAVNCQSPVDGDACNKCASCIGIENGSILDVLELDAASNNGVDNIRALREEAVYTPALVKKRIYIVDEVHMLSTSAFNALLKILEEPPEHLIFILATTELHKVPATIMSRCQRFMFKRISADAITARLNDIAEKEGITLTDDASKKLASLADGSMRDAISLFDQCASGSVVDIECILDTIGLAGQQEVSRLADAIADRDINAALDILDNLYKDGRDMVSLLNELAALMRDLLVFKLSPKSPLVAAGRDSAELSMLSEKFCSERLFFSLELIREAVYNLTRSGAIRLTTEMCLIRMCDERLSDDTTAILSRVTRLEEQGIGNGELRIENGEQNAVNGELRVRGRGAHCASATGELESKPETKPEPEIKSKSISEPDVSTESEIESQPESEPEPKSEPETEHKSEPNIDSESDDFWTDILKQLESEPSLYAVVSNKDRVWAELKEGFITIRASDQFTVNQLEMDMFLNPLKDAAKKALGRETVIRIEMGTRDSSKDSGADKLDALRAFDNVQFE